MAFHRSCSAFLGRLRARRSHSCSSLRTQESAPDAATDFWEGAHRVNSQRGAWNGLTSTAHLPPLPPQVVHPPGVIDSFPYIKPPYSPAPTLPPSLPYVSMPPTAKPSSGTVLKRSRQPPSVQMRACRSPPRTPIRQAKVRSMNSTHCSGTPETCEHLPSIERSAAVCKEELPCSKVTVSIMSAMTGELVAKVTLPISAAFADLKHEVEKKTGNRAFQMRFLLDNSAEEMQGQDFDPLQTVLGAVETITLNLLLSQLPPCDVTSSALPFAAGERDYLPASGLADAALGLSQWRFGNPTPWQRVC